MGNFDQHMTIVVGFDGSDTARRALMRAQQLSVPGSRILIVTAVPELRSPGLNAPLAGGTVEPAALASGLEELIGVEDASIEALSLPGDAAEVLVETARRSGADLLIVGRRGRDFVAKALLGSVSQRVVGQAPCDVLVVA